MLLLPGPKRENILKNYAEQYSQDQEKKLVVETKRKQLQDSLKSGVSNTSNKLKSKKKNISS